MLVDKKVRIKVSTFLSISYGLKTIERIKQIRKFYRSKK